MFPRLAASLLPLVCSLWCRIGRVAEFVEGPNRPHPFEHAISLAHTPGTIKRRIRISTCWTRCQGSSFDPRSPKISMVCELHRASIINAHLQCCSNSSAIRPRRLRGVQSLASQIASNSNYQTDTDWSSSVQKVTVRWSLWPSELMIVSNRSWTATRATSLIPRVGAFASCVSPHRLKLRSTSHHLLGCLHGPALSLPQRRSSTFCRMSTSVVLAYRFTFMNASVTSLTRTALTA